MPSYMQTKENKKQTRLVIAIFLAPTFSWKSFDKKEIGISKTFFYGVGEKLIIRACLRDNLL